MSDNNASRMEIIVVRHPKPFFANLNNSPTRQNLKFPGKRIEIGYTFSQYRMSMSSNVKHLPILSPSSDQSFDAPNASQSRHENPKSLPKLTSLDDFFIDEEDPLLKLEPSHKVGDEGEYAPHQFRQRAPQLSVVENPKFNPEAQNRKVRLKDIHALDIVIITCVLGAAAYFL